MRASCLECVLKHLGSAAVYIEECEMGYPNYFGYVYGQLDHAASECVSAYPDLAWAIREHRIKWANSRKEGKPHLIPFEAMFDYIETMESVNEVLAVPDEVYAGLDIGESGKPVFSMDTRPSAVARVESEPRNGAPETHLKPEPPPERSPKKKEYSFPLDNGDSPAGV